MAIQLKQNQYCDPRCFDPDPDFIFNVGLFHAAESGWAKKHVLSDHVHLRNLEVNARIRTPWYGSCSGKTVCDSMQIRIRATRNKLMLLQRECESLSSVITSTEQSSFLPENPVRAVDQMSGLEGGQALLGGRFLAAQMKVAEQGWTMRISFVGIQHEILVCLALFDAQNLNGKFHRCYVRTCKSCFPHPSYPIQMSLSCK